MFEVSPPSIFTYMETINFFRQIPIPRSILGMGWHWGDIFVVACVSYTLPETNIAPKNDGFQ